MHLLAVQWNIPALPTLHVTGFKKSCLLFSALRHCTAHLVFISGNTRLKCFTAPSAECGTSSPSPRTMTLRPQIWKHCPYKTVASSCCWKSVASSVINATMIRVGRQFVASNFQSRIYIELKFWLLCSLSVSPWCIYTETALPHRLFA